MTHRVHHERAGRSVRVDGEVIDVASDRRRWLEGAGDLVRSCRRSPEWQLIPLQLRSGTHHDRPTLLLDSVEESSLLIDDHPAERLGSILRPDRPGVVRVRPCDEKRKSVAAHGNQLRAFRLGNTAAEDRVEDLLIVDR